MKNNVLTKITVASPNGNIKITMIQKEIFINFFIFLKFHDAISVLREKSEHITK